MDTNKILQSCYKILDISKDEMVEVFKLGGYELNIERVHGYLQEKDDKEYLDCGYEALGSFLDGLIIYKRGPSDKKSVSDEDIRLNNNLILKKLRIAYELKEVDLYEIFSAVDIDITKGELNALFRKEGHKNYRACPDSILQLFLDGLEICESELDA
jgi:uncharacterized protein YehS (DUF1456 family)